MINTLFYFLQDANILLFLLITKPIVNYNLITHDILMNKIALISLGACRKEYPYQQHMTYITPPGIRYVKAALSNYGFNVGIIDQPNENILDEDIIERIKAFNPEMVLFNQFFSTRSQVRKIISSLGNKYAIGIGGHDVTFQVDYLSESSLREQYRGVDFLWRGEADRGLAEFIDGYKRPGSLSIIDNRPNRVQDLDSLPVLPHDDYNGEIGFIVTSRGCFSNGCDFCSTSRFYPDGWRYRSFEHVERELLNLKKNNRKFIAVFDDNFFGFTDESLERGAAIINKCRDLDLKIIFLMASVKQVADLNDRGYLGSFRGTLNNVFLGLENIDDNALRVLGKRCNVNTYKNLSATAIDALDANGISMFLGYINFNPFSTLEELENNARFLHENHDQASQFLYLSKKLQLFEGTRFFDNYVRDNDVSADGISGAEYLYDFKDRRVGRVSSIIKLVQNETMMFDCVDFETSTLLYVNQLQNGKYGKEYASLKKEISNNNFEFFMKLLDLCGKDDSNAVDVFDLLGDYKEKFKKNIGRTKDLYVKIKENSQYVINEPVEHVERVCV